jgi:hypothetical protein
MSKLKWKPAPDEPDVCQIATVKLTNEVCYEVDVIERKIVIWNVGVTLRDGTWVPVKQGKCRDLDKAKIRAEACVMRLVDKAIKDLQKWRSK